MIMNRFAVVFLLATSAMAQDLPAMSASEAACGSVRTKFEANVEGTPHSVPQPEADKALVFVIEDLGGCPDCFNGSHIASDVSSAVVKIGYDGAWAGADRGNSYLFFTASPGEHHLCINWQSRLSVRSRAFAMAKLDAEAGKTYYFRARVFPGENNYLFDLDPVDEDQGKFMVASSPYSVSHAKK